MYTKGNQSWKVGLILGLTLSLMVVPVFANGASSSQEKGLDRSAILSKAADNLGIEESKLTEAFRQAFLEVATNEIDERVKEGWLGEKKSRVNQGRTSGENRGRRTSNDVWRRNLRSFWILRWQYGA